jgi:hypothetical protein
MGVRGHRHAPTSYSQGKELDSHCIGDRLGLSTGLDGHGKKKNISSHWGSTPKRPGRSETTYPQLVRILRSYLDVRAW